MCRWFTYISPAEPCLLSDTLLTPANAITKQVSDHYLPGLLPHGKEHNLHNSKDALLRLRNNLLNFDGVGVAWYTDASSAYTACQNGPRPTFYKSPLPPGSDAVLKSLCANTETKCVFAHVRAASGTAVTRVNCHPFVFGRHVFMHNGVISGFARIKMELCGLMAFDAFAAIAGTSDSEHAAALYVTFLCGKEGTREDWEGVYGLEAMQAALQRTVVTIMEVQKRVLGEGMKASSMNFAVTDGERLVACRFRNHETELPCSLYWSETAGRTLNRKYPGSPDGDFVNESCVYGEEVQHGTHTIVASEPTTFDEKEWKLIEKNHMLLVDEKGVEIEVALKYDHGLNASS